MNPEEVERLLRDIVIRAGEATRNPWLTEAANKENREQWAAIGKLAAVVADQERRMREMEDRIILGSGAAS